MYSHAPENYVCPFCKMVEECRTVSIDESRHAIVYHDDAVTVLVPLHHFADIKGNVILITNHHYENIFDIDYRIGSDILKVVQIIANAMKKAYKCDGISTRQHNEPAGNQDVWHYHLHIFPRYTGDQLYLGRGARYEQEERQHYAGMLRKSIEEMLDQTG
ncbi:MAG: HIT family protein [Armatimonadota bacterium]